MSEHRGAWARSGALDRRSGAGIVTCLGRKGFALRGGALRRGPSIPSRGTEGIAAYAAGAAIRTRFGLFSRARNLSHAHELGAPRPRRCWQILLPSGRTEVETSQFCSRSGKRRWAWNCARSAAFRNYALGAPIVFWVSRSARAPEKAGGSRFGFPPRRSAISSNQKSSRSAKLTRRPDPKRPWEAAKVEVIRPKSSESRLPIGFANWLLLVML